MKYWVEGIGLIIHKHNIIIPNNMHQCSLALMEGKIGPVDAHGNWNPFPPSPRHYCPSLLPLSVGHLGIWVPCKFPKAIFRLIGQCASSRIPIPPFGYFKPIYHSCLDEWMNGWMDGGCFRLHSNVISHCFVFYSQRGIG